jgi:hypothetical protein
MVRVPALANDPVIRPLLVPGIAANVRPVVPTFAETVGSPTGLSAVSVYEMASPAFTVILSGDVIAGNGVPLEKYSN